MIQQIPNLISVLRLLLVPWFAIFLLEQRFDLALVLFILMGLSDALDGLLARFLNASSALGAALDPLADKVMLISAFVLLGHLDFLPVWLVVLVVARDVLVVGGSLLRYLFHPEWNFRVLRIGKINTFAQIVLVFSIIVNQLHALPSAVLEVLLWATVGTTLVSGAWYLLVWARLLAQPDAAAR